MAKRPGLIVIRYDAGGAVTSVEHEVVYEAQANFDRGKGLEPVIERETRALIGSRVSTATKDAVAALVASVESDLGAT